MPPASERLFPRIFGEMSLAETFRKCDVIRIRHDFSNHIDVVCTANRRGGLVSNQQAQGDAADEDDLIQKRGKFVNRSSNSGKLGSGIDLLAEQFDSEVSLSRSSATDCIAERENAVELEIS